MKTMPTYDQAAGEQRPRYYRVERKFCEGRGVKLAVSSLVRAHA